MRMSCQINHRQHQQAVKKSLARERRCHSVLLTKVFMCHLILEKRLKKIRMKLGFTEC